MTELTHKESAQNTTSGVRVIEDVRIPMPDGVELAARVWLPRHAEPRPVPAVLEYIPYRKRDFTRARDETMHPYMAAHGYVRPSGSICAAAATPGVC